jgi:hypothetical protein
MKLKSDAAIGDAVEVEMISKAAGCEPVSEWFPATIVFISRVEIGVAFSDGSRLSLPRYSSDWKMNC